MVLWDELLALGGEGSSSDDLPAGDDVIRFVDPTNRHQAQYCDGVDGYGAATAVTVTGGIQVADVDALVDR